MRNLKEEIRNELLADHVGFVSTYLHRHRVRHFSAQRYEQALRRQPVVLAEIIDQPHEEISTAFEGVVSLLKPLRFGYAELAETVENGFTPSLEPAFKSSMRESCKAAARLADYSVTTKSKFNPASFLKQAILDKNLRAVPAHTVLRKLDESIEFNVRHGAKAAGALVVRMRYPEAFHTGRAEIESHLDGMQAYYGDVGFSRDKYLKSVFRPDFPCPRVLSIAPDTLRSSATGLIEQLGPSGLTKAAWLDAIIEHPYLLLRSQEDLMDRIRVLHRRLEKHGVDEADVSALYAKNPKLFVRDPSALLERVEALQTEFGQHGLTATRIVRGIRACPSLVRVQTNRLVDNISGMASYLESEGVDTAPYFAAVGNNMALALTASERQCDNHRLVAQSYAEGLLPDTGGRASDPRVLALANSGPLMNSGEDLALRRLWSRQCVTERPTVSGFFGTRRAQIESDLREVFGNQADMHELAQQELQRVEAKLGITFGALTHGDISKARRMSPQRRQPAAAGLEL